MELFADVIRCMLLSIILFVFSRQDMFALVYPLHTLAHLAVRAQSRVFLSKSEYFSRALYIELYSDEESDLTPLTGCDFCSITQLGR